jgi:hypothetical protein
MALIGLFAIVMMCIAVAKSTHKTRTFLYIIGWTIAITAGASLIAYAIAIWIHCVNPPGLAGDIAGATLALTMICASAYYLRRDKGQAANSGAAIGSCTEATPIEPRRQG